MLAVEILGLDVELQAEPAGKWIAEVELTVTLRINKESARGWGFIDSLFLTSCC